MSKNEPDLIYSTIVGTIGGFIAGVLMGVVQLVYVPELATWSYGPIILLICALGWAGYGAIAGGGGAFARRSRTRVEAAKPTLALEKSHS
jgi:hypothetical protein